MLVTESVTLPVRGPTEKTVAFEKLLASGKSDTLRHESLTVQMVSQPAWYAVMALPYLMETPRESTDAVFSRLYANALARHIANSDPKMRRVFDLWRNPSPQPSPGGRGRGGTEALDSPLEKNPDLKSLMLEETPWLVQAEDESRARRQVGILFDTNRLDSEQVNTLAKLQQLQLGDGLWPWYPGMPGDHTMTLTIVTGFGRLRHLGVGELDMAAAIKALGALDAWIDAQYRDLQEGRRRE